MKKNIFSEMYPIKETLVPLLLYSTHVEFVQLTMLNTGENNVWDNECVLAEKKNLPKCKVQTFPLVANPITHEQRTKVRRGEFP